MAAQPPRQQPQQEPPPPPQPAYPALEDLGQRRRLSPPREEKCSPAPPLVSPDTIAAELRLLEQVEARVLPPFHQRPLHPQPEQQQPVEGDVRPWERWAVAATADYRRHHSETAPGMPPPQLGAPQPLQQPSRSGESSPLPPPSHASADEAQADAVSGGASHRLVSVPTGPPPPRRQSTAGSRSACSAGAPGGSRRDLSDLQRRLSSMRAASAATGLGDSFAALERQLLEAQEAASGGSGSSRRGSAVSSLGQPGVDPEVSASTHPQPTLGPAPAGCRSIATSPGPRAPPGSAATPQLLEVTSRMGSQRIDPSLTVTPPPPQGPPSAGPRPGTVSRVQSARSVRTAAAGDPEDLGRSFSLRSDHLMREGSRDNLVHAEDLEQAEQAVSRRGSRSSAALDRRRGSGPAASQPCGQSVQVVSMSTRPRDVGAQGQHRGAADAAQPLQQVGSSMSTRPHDGEPAAAAAAGQQPMQQSVQVVSMSTRPHQLGAPCASRQTSSQRGLGAPRGSQRQPQGQSMSTR
eukprot:TRINITY_DN8618_c0_g1_i1.p1 TRINITY_DN8618_c0_g1~~TRINITY_DN8618_c0_g1_i1.p1  ORF type:complete len:593 (+),score=179.32 TRINITY_DN8618_c0_g1_i1:221-1780(+)